ncbi:MAG: hypothetical protein ACI8TQ_002830, partial [Planctomycetota bacterium]
QSQMRVLEGFSRVAGRAVLNRICFQFGTGAENLAPNVKLVAVHRAHWAQQRRSLVFVAGEVLKKQRRHP